MAPRTLNPLPLFDEPSVLQVLADAGVKPVHATRMWKHLIRNEGAQIDDVPELPRAAVDALNARCVMFTSTLVDVLESSDGQTTKLLIELQDGNRVESVIMRYREKQRVLEDGTIATADAWSTICVSSQVGCLQGCTFCSTATMGMKGNLFAGEILEQLAYGNIVSRRKYNDNIRNVVFMGMVCLFDGGESS